MAFDPVAWAKANKPIVAGGIIGIVAFSFYRYQQQRKAQEKTIASELGKTNKELGSINQAIRQNTQYDLMEYGTYGWPGFGSFSPGGSSVSINDILQNSISDQSRSTSSTSATSGTDIDKVVRRGPFNPHDPFGGHMPPVKEKTDTRGKKLSGGAGFGQPMASDMVNAFPGDASDYAGYN